MYFQQVRAAFTEFIISYGSYNEEIQIVGVENPGPERVPNMKRGSLPATGGNGLFGILTNRNKFDDWSVQLVP